MSNPCTFAYDSTGRIQYANQSAEATATWSSTLSVVTLDDTATPTGLSVFANQENYLIVAGAAVLRPYWTLTQSTTSGVVTVIATLDNPPTTLPTDTTFTVAGTTIPVTLSTTAPYTASVAFTADTLVQVQSIPVLVTATGVKRARIDIGTSSGSNSSIQAIAPSTTGNTSTTAYRITTTSKDYAAMAFMEQAQTDMAAILGSLQTLVQMMLVDLYGKGGIRQSLAQSTYTPVPLDTAGNEANALADIQANLLPHTGWSLANVLPVGGAEMYHYAATKVHIPNTTNAALQYAQFIAETPNLV